MCEMLYFGICISFVSKTWLTDNMNTHSVGVYDSVYIIRYESECFFFSRIILKKLDAAYCDILHQLLVSRNEPYHTSKIAIMKNWERQQRQMPDRVIYLENSVRMFRIKKNAPNKRNAFSKCNVIWNDYGTVDGTQRQ